jgi:hypothetical protein
LETCWWHFRCPGSSGHLKCESRDAIAKRGVGLYRNTLLIDIFSLSGAFIQTGLSSLRIKRFFYLLIRLNSVFKRGHSFKALTLPMKAPGLEPVLPFASSVFITVATLRILVILRIVFSEIRTGRLYLIIRLIIPTWRS